MTAIWERIRRHPAREPLTEAYEVRAFRDESEQPVSSGAPSGRSRRIPRRGMEVVALPAAPQPDTGAIQAAKDRVLGHGEQRLLPDDCQFGNNDLCNVEA